MILGTGGTIAGRILGTGGTIAGRADSDAPGYKSGVLNVDALVRTAPEIRNIADVSAEQIANIGSQDMNDSVWLALARRIAELRAADNVAGVVITHGTDTMEETAFFLDLLFPSGAPIILTGSVRRSDAMSADGPANLRDAVVLASAPEARNRGAMVTMSGQIHTARAVRKGHIEDLDALSSGAMGLAGRFVAGKPTIFRAPRPGGLPDFDVTSLVALPKVGIVFGHANLEPGTIRYFAEEGYVGLILAGVGNGNASEAVLSTLADVSAGGLWVVRASRVDIGFVTRNIEVEDDAMKFAVSVDLSPQKARILTQLAGALESRQIAA